MIRIGAWSSRLECITGQCTTAHFSDVRPHQTRGVLSALRFSTMCAFYLLLASFTLPGCSKSPDESASGVVQAPAEQESATGQSLLQEPEAAQQPQQPEPPPLPDYLRALPFEAAAMHPGALALSADGNVAAHISLDGSIVVWNARTFESLETLPAEGTTKSRPGTLALNSDGSLLVIGRFDAVVALYSRSETKTLRELRGHSGAISALAFSSNGRLLASGGDDATTYVWEVATGRRVHTFDSRKEDSNGGIPVGLGFSGDGRALLVNEWYSRHYDVARGTSVWDLDEGVEIGWRSVAPPNGDNVMRNGQALGANNWLLAYTNAEGLAVERLDSCDKPRVAGPAITDPTQRTGHFANTVAADPLGRWVAALEYQQLRFYGTSGEAAPITLELPIRPIALVPHPNGERLFVLSIKDTRINGNEHFIFGRDAETVTAGALYVIAIPEAVRQLPVVSAKPGASRCPPSASARKQWSYRLPDRVPTLPVKEDAVLDDEMRNKLRSFHFFVSGIGSQVVIDAETGDNYRIVDGRIEQNEADENPLLFVVREGKRVYTAAARNGYLAILYEDGTGELWHTTTGASWSFSSDWGDGCEFGAPRMSADSRFLEFSWVCGDGETLLIKDMRNDSDVVSGFALGQFPKRSTRIVMLYSRANHLLVFDLNSREQLAVLPHSQSRGPSGNYHNLQATISDDGNLVACASFDGLVRVWDIDARRVVGEAKLNGEVKTMVFDSAGRSLAVKVMDGKMVFLDTSGQSAATKNNEQ